MLIYVMCLRSELEEFRERELLDRIPEYEGLSQRLTQLSYKCRSVFRASTFGDQSERFEFKSSCFRQDECFDMYEACFTYFKLALASLS